MPPTTVGQDRENTPAATALSLAALSSPLLPASSAPVDLGALEPEVREFLESSSINSAIKNLYNAVEPWVYWGFEVAQYVVGWIPVAGYFAPQITILYNFGEQIVQSVVFNLDDWIFGPLPFFDGLRNVISDTWDAGWNLLYNELAWLLPPLPPLPPIPPCPSWLCGSAVAEAPLAAVHEADISQRHGDSLSELLKFQADAAKNLAQSVGEALALFAKDLLTTGGQAVADLLQHGLVAAAVNALTATWESIVVRGGQAADGFAEYLDAQRDYFGAAPESNEDTPPEDSREPAQQATPTAEEDGDSAVAVNDSSDTDSGGAPVGETPPADGVTEEAEMGEQPHDADGPSAAADEITEPETDPAGNEMQHDAAEAPSPPDDDAADDDAVDSGEAADSGDTEP
ncbi:hypothetical protein PDG61_06650 [Mycolicibacterium sp. BiH015]|uniref:hypothetical protein n=1 Tax=Mycolicibacterium sp. BiH015 TaxID=3018808 RepID=UPI0022E3B84A|nr:hypothetical protein [Mycolicibacterium sp. BiH015]MDA2890582.1 hypothetical protein [Mycolicibacterium sp. BiH015]